MHYKNVKKVFNGLSYTIDDIKYPNHNPRGEYDLVRVRSVQRGDLGASSIHYGVCGGGNSGYQAVNLAYILGAKTILLLGFDMHGDHYFGQHQKPLRNGSPFNLFIESFKTITKDVEIINCTRHSALHCFPEMSIDHVLDN